MITITEAHVTSSAPPAAFFDRWADMATWPEWNTDTEWVRLDGPFAQGATGMLKPRGGPKVKFVIDQLVANRTFVDVSKLVGARLTFRHEVSTPAPGTTQIDVVVTAEGPLARVWTAILGKGFRATVQPDLDRLAGVAEGRG